MITDASIVRSFTSVLRTICSSVKTSMISFSGRVGKEKDCCAMFSNWIATAVGFRCSTVVKNLDLARTSGCFWIGLKMATAVLWADLDRQQTTQVCTVQPWTYDNVSRYMDHFTSLDELSAPYTCHLPSELADDIPTSQTPQRLPANGPLNTARGNPDEIVLRQSTICR